MRTANLIALAAPLLLALAASAQVPPGHAVVLHGAPTRLVLVTLAGVQLAVTSPSALAAATSVLVASDGACYLGMSTTGSAATPALAVRRLWIQGTTIVQDTAYASLLPVPTNLTWYVTDMAELPDGALLVGAEELKHPTLGPQSAAFVVAPGGAVRKVATQGGRPEVVGYAADRLLLGELTGPPSAFTFDVWSLPVSGSGAAFRVASLAQAGLYGLGADADGTLIACPYSSVSTVFRVAHAPSGAQAPVPGAPPQQIFAGCDFVRASGLVAMLTWDSVNPIDLLLADARTGGYRVWTSGLPTWPADVSVRKNPDVYGPEPKRATTPTWLGSRGGAPAVSNAAFGLLAGGLPGAPTGVAVSAGPTLVPLPFGTLLIDPMSVVPLASFVMPASGVQPISLAVPNVAALRGQRLCAQAAGADPTSLLDLSRALSVVVE